MITIISFAEVPLARCTILSLAIWTKLAAGLGVLNFYLSVLIDLDEFFAAQVVIDTLKMKT